MMIMREERLEKGTPGKRLPEVHVSEADRS
jgi:hypothetical protein